MKLVKYAAAMSLALAMTLSSAAFAQPPAAGPGGGDQIDQLDQLVHLTDSQKQDMREMMHKTQATLADLGQQARESQMKLVASIKPDFDEDDIRENASELGELTGKISAETALLQARIQKALTAEQRAALEQQMQQEQPR